MPNISLLPKHIHIYSVTLSKHINNQDQVTKLWKILSAQEKQRAQKPINQELQNKFIISHGLLRQILAQYLNCNAAAITFSYNEYGKPSLNTNQKQPPLSFNTSHSKDLVVYAVSQDSELGIDVEYVRDKFRLAQDIATKFFAKEEAQAIFSLPASQQLSAFFNCWSRKEALVKALGTGIYHPLKDFVVKIAANETSQVNDWSIIPLLVHPDYTAALASKISKPTLEYFTW